MGWYPLLNYVRNSYLFDKFAIELVVKRGQMGGCNADTFVHIFSADNLNFLFLVTDIFLEERIIRFFS